MLVRPEQSAESKSAATLVPSPRLLRAALSGLVAFGGAAGCDDDDKQGKTEGSAQNLSDEQLSALCADMAKKAEPKPDSPSQPQAVDTGCEDEISEAKSACEKPDVDALCKEQVTAAKNACPKPDATALCSDMVKSAQAMACVPKAPEEKTTSAEQKEYTFAQLTKMCDERGGYVQIHAACGGTNTCKGFSYGDWGPGAATLTEHTCTGVNGCAGLSCVVGPEDKRNKSGAELYDLKFGDAEPSACSNCHAVHEDHDKADLTKFIVYVMAGSTRNASNWLQRTAAEQERVVAFGAHSTEPQGRAIQNMASYSQVLSRKEIERVVAHIRTLTPVIKTIKIADP